MRAACPAAAPQIEQRVGPARARSAPSCSVRAGLPSTATRTSAVPPRGPRRRTRPPGARPPAAARSNERRDPCPPGDERAPARRRRGRPRALRRPPRSRRRGGPQRRRTERQLLDRRPPTRLPPATLAALLNVQPHPVVAGVQQRRGHGDVVALLAVASTSSVPTGFSLTNTDTRCAGASARIVIDSVLGPAPPPAPSPSASTGRNASADSPATSDGRLPLVLLAEQPGGLPAAVDVLEKVEAAGVDDQPPVAVRDGVDAVGDQVDRRPVAGGVGRGGGSRRRRGHRGRGGVQPLAGLRRAPAARDQEGDRRPDPRAAEPSDRAKRTKTGHRTSNGHLQRKYPGPPQTSRNLPTSPGPEAQRRRPVALSWAVTLVVASLR